MSKLALLVLAAGMGSRYGGLKQIDPVWQNGETIMDYSVYDAIRAGFDQLTFVIRRDIEEPFRRSIGSKFEERIDVTYVFQELSKLPAGFSVPPSRQKPWGTGHAILMAEEAIRTPFAAINADDFYGMRSFRLLAEHLRADSPDYAMVGFVLKNTLSEFGGVARGICRTTPEGFLRAVTELTRIEKVNGTIRYTDADGAHPLTGEEIVSMNMWGFNPGVFAHLRERLIEFLKTRGQEEKSEIFIPTVVNDLVAAGQARVKVLRTSDTWLGVTYREDRPFVVEGIRRCIEAGDYPANLWS